MTSEGTIVGGRFRLDQPIGRGRAGIVWLAFDTRLFRTVAMKRMYLPVGLPADRAEAAKAQAMQEGKNAAKIEHACAITVFDVLPEGQDVWLVMEYIPSRSMATFLAEHGRLSPDQAAALGIQLGGALATIHAAGFVHRTLEPGTVLLADDGGVKLTDIGIAGGGPNPAYVAPEVTHGLPPSPPADVYSLGATLYTAVEGVPPFGDDGQSSERPPQNAGVLAAALRKMLRQDPAARPTMQDTVIALSAITEGRETQFIPPTAPAMPTMPVSRPIPPGPSPQFQQQIPVTPPGYPQATPPPYSLQQAPTEFMRPPPPAQPGTAGLSPATKKWVMTGVAILAAVILGILISELFFV